MPEAWPDSPAALLVGGAGLALAALTCVALARALAAQRELRRRNRELAAEIAERTRAEEQRRRSEEQLRLAQRMEAMGSLAAGVAHDFNNLLLVISAQCSQLTACCTSDEQRESLDIVENAVEQARDLTRSLLTFGRSVPTRRQAVDLRASTAVVARMIERTLPATIQFMATGLEGPPVWVRGDESQLQQIVVNLALNARDAMPSGGELRLTLDSIPDPDGAPAGSVARLTVSDTGSGIPSDVRARIFEPFFSTKPPGEGTGLGLAFVHATVDDHGGTIEIRSDHYGTTFIIDLPQVDTDPQPEPRPAAPLPPRGHGECILVVDDDQPVREVLAAYLVAHGYEVVQAGDGEAAFHAFEAQRERVRLLLLDVDLPKRNGLELLRELRRRGVELPALVMTGGAESALHESDGVSLFLAKPFQLAELGQLVQRLLRDAEDAP